MPKLKIERVVSFSSEDNVHTADNILNEDSKKKWLCKTPGEKSAIVILQLEKPSSITGLDIGNEHSAFVEVLVGRSTFDNSEYKVLLTTSSFMTPLDSRQSQNVNRVRMFSIENFCKPICDERWDRLKLVCTQPFNKHVQYGLSFVIIHSSDGQSSESNGTAAVLKLGKFKLLPEPPKDEIVAGSLFLKRKELESEKPSTAAAAIRGASPTKILENKTGLLKAKKVNSSSSPKHDIGTVSRNRNEIFYDDEDSTDNKKIDTVMQKHKQDKINKQDTTNIDGKDQKIVHNKCNEESSSTNAKNTNQAAGTSEKRTSESLSNKPKKKKKVIRTKPFSELFSGVVFVISGYQNPLRAEIREKALQMGGKYRPDWGPDSTHLICAFSNTPKYNQVRGHGKIVRSNWIQDCYNNRKRLPWRRYALNPRDQNRPESEDEILDEDLLLNEKENRNERTFNISSDSDNENETEIVPSENKNQTEPSDREQSSSTNLKNDNCVQDIYNRDTDEEELIEPNINSQATVLPSFFSDYIFCIDEQLEDADIIKRYIIAYAGEIVSDVQKCQYFITESKQKREELSSEKVNMVCVKPLWIYLCEQENYLIPYNDYILSA